MIIADENLETYWIELLRNRGMQVFSIRENMPGITDLKIIELVKEKKGVLITEDKDFGELVFAHGISGLSIVFLRYDQPDYKSIQDQLLKAIDLFYENEETIFITVTQKKTRIRKI